MTEPMRTAVSEVYERSVFTCPAGTFRGLWDGTVVRVRGVRYARAARFQPPRPEPPAPEPVDAFEPGPPCPQLPDPLLEHLIGSVAGVGADEDCLRLSVTIPSGVDPAVDRLPVMVWIHGGAYVTGAGDLPVYDPAALVSEQRVVVVSVTYRLGLLGFLGSSAGRPANLGLLDLLEALRWVQRNIAGFGGDPDRVTTFGESAGGDAIAHLMVVEGARGLFGRAIVQSAPLGIARRRAGMHRRMYQRAGELSADTPLEHVLRMQLHVAGRAVVEGLRGGMPFSTQYGMEPLPAEHDVDSAWQRVAADVDVLIGTNAREAALFTRALPLHGRLASLPAVGPRLVDVLERIVVKVVTHLVYDAASDRLANRLGRAGGHVFRYRLTWDIPGNPYASAHAVELGLLFPGDVWAQTRLLAGVSERDLLEWGAPLREAWAEFARTGRISEGEVAGLLNVRRGDKVSPVRGRVRGFLRRPSANATSGAGGPGRGPAR